MKAISKTLIDLIASHGEDIIQQPQRLKAMLADLLPHEKRMRYLLELSLRAEIPAKLKDIQKAEAEVRETKTNALKHYFKEEYFLEDNAVKSVFDCWGEVMLFIISIELSLEYDHAEGEYFDEYGVKYNASKTKLLKLKDNLIHYNILPSTKVICSKAFYCSGLKSIFIPDSVELIGSIDFFEDDEFEEFVVSTLNMHFTTIDGVLYSKDKTKIIKFPLSKSISYFNIPLSVSHVETDAFQCCKFIKSISIPHSVKSIHYSAFSECENLEEFIVDEKNKEFCSIDGVLYSKDKKKIRRFPNAKIITEYQILNGVEMIVSMAFDACINLESVLIPESVTQIGFKAFSNCIKLIQLIIPQNVYLIEESAFSGCIKLNSLSVNGKNKNFEIRDRSLIDLNENKLLFYPVQSNYRTYKIPDGVITIAYNAFFFNCILEEISFSDCMSTIDKQAFFFCRNLKHVYLEKNIKEIRNSAFYHCYELRSVNFLNSQTIIGEDIFMNCNNLELICIDYTDNSTDSKLYENLIQIFKNQESITILKSSLWSQHIFQTIDIIAERIARDVINGESMDRAKVNGITKSYMNLFIKIKDAYAAKGSATGVAHMQSYLDNWDNLERMIFYTLKRRSGLLFKDMIFPISYDNSNGLSGNLFLFLSSLKNGKTHYLTGDSFFEPFNYIIKSLKSIIPESDNSLQSIIYTLKEYNKEKDVFWINDIIAKLNSEDLEEDIETEFLEMMNKK